MQRSYEYISVNLFIDLRMNYYFELNFSQTLVLECGIREDAVKSSYPLYERIPKACKVVIQSADFINKYRPHLIDSKLDSLLKCQCNLLGISLTSMITLKNCVDPNHAEYGKQLRGEL